MNNHRPGIVIERRVVPFPTSISAEAQDVLRRLVREDGVPHNAAFVPPAPDDHGAWRKLQTVADSRYAAMVQGTAPTIRSSVETVKIGSTTLHIATPAAPTWSEHVYIALHGGALVFGGGEACRIGAQMQADQHGVQCYGVDYRMPPEYPFPAALDDCMAAYRYALERHEPAQIVIGGRSAGGNLAVGMLLRAKAEGLPMPVGLVLLSPEVDLTESGDSFEVNRLVDVVLPYSLMATNLLYADGADLSSPYLSPLFGDLSGLPATFLQSGTRDLFLSNTVRMHRALRRAGVVAALHVFEAMPHGGFMGGTPEDQELAEETARFVTSCWT